MAETSPDTGREGAEGEQRGNRCRKAEKNTKKDLAATGNPKSNAYAPNPGQTSSEDLEIRISLVYALLQKGWRKGKIKRKVIETFGVSARTCESYLSRARQELRDETGKPRSEHVEDMYAVLTGIIENPKSLPKDVIGAVREIHRIFLASGERNPAAILNQQTNVAVVVPPGLSAPATETDEDVVIGELDLESRRTQISALAERVRARVLPAGAG